MAFRDNSLLLKAKDSLNKVSHFIFKLTDLLFKLKL